MRNVWRKNPNQYKATQCSRLEMCGAHRAEQHWVLNFKEMYFSALLKKKKIGNL